MKGFDEFLNLFGGITVFQIVQVVVVIIFLATVGKKVRDYLVKRHDAEVEKDKQLAEALEGVRKYPEYRQQSIDAQNKLREEIAELREMQKENAERLMAMEEAEKRRERNKLRNTLIQNYRYYTNADTNPSHSWTKMESEAFWELFKDYEEAGGNGFMHSDVRPAMEALNVIEIGRR